MSNMTYIRASHQELATVVPDETRSKGERSTHLEWSGIRPSLLAIGASVLVMAGLIALRLWFLMPGAFHFVS